MSVPLDTTHSCPGGCGAAVARNKFADPACWSRLPRELQTPITSAYRRGDFHAHVDAMMAARQWYRANPLPIRRS